MGGIIGRDLEALIGRGWRRTLEALEFFREPWTLIQIGTIAAILVLGFGLGRILERRLEARLRKVQTGPRAMRFMALLLRRTSWIIVALALWAVVLAGEPLTGEGPLDLVRIAAALVTAWVAISVVTRLIHNRSLAHALAFVLWAIVALRITGLYDPTIRSLDALGFTIGEARISLLLLIKTALILGALVWIAVEVGNFVSRRLEATTDLTPSLRVLLGKIVRIVLVATACLAALNAVGIDLAALTFFSGALGVGIGFGLQKVVSNFVSGIIILMDRSIKPGDTISLGETYGWIRSLHSRFVSVKTRDGKEYLIPNEDFITQQVVSWSFEESLIRLDVTFGVSYSSDPHEVSKLAIEAAKGIARVQENPPPVCWLTAFGESSLDFILRFWIRDPQNGSTNIRGQVLLSCWDAFEKAGIRHAYPRRDVTLRLPADSSPLGAERDAVSSIVRGAAEAP